MAWPWALTLLSACGAGAPQLQRRLPQLADFVIVPRPPPVVPLEIQPARPAQHAVWLEGQWRWDNERWRWKPGGWVAPPPGAAVSVWVYAYQQDGQVRFWPAAWFDAQGRRIEEPPVLARATRRSERR
jgi:hypothetical protein